jgi:hypothetical protein
MNHHEDHNEGRTRLARPLGYERGGAGDARKRYRPSRPFRTISLGRSVKRGNKEMRALVPQPLPQLRNDAARSVHVGVVLFPKPIEHHPLLARHPQNVQGRKQRQTRQARNPVLQQQSLRYAPQPLGGHARGSREEDVVHGGAGVGWHGEHDRRRTHRSDPDRPGARTERRLAVGKKQDRPWGLLP